MQITQWIYVAYSQLTSLRSAFVFLSIQHATSLSFISMVHGNRAYIWQLQSPSSNNPQTPPQVFPYLHRFITTQHSIPHRQQLLANLCTRILTARGIHTTPQFSLLTLSSHVTGFGYSPHTYCIEAAMTFIFHKRWHGFCEQQSQLPARHTLHKHVAGNTAVNNLPRSNSFHWMTINISPGQTLPQQDRPFPRVGDQSHTWPYPLGIYASSNTEVMGLTRQSSYTKPLRHGNISLSAHSNFTEGGN